MLLPHSKEERIEEVLSKDQAPVYDIFPSAVAIVDNALGLEKLSANQQFFDDAQTAVSLQQTSEIIPDVWRKVPESDS